MWNGLTLTGPHQLEDTVLNKFYSSNGSLRTIPRCFREFADDSWVFCGIYI